MTPQEVKEVLEQFGIAFSDEDIEDIADRDRATKGAHRQNLKKD
jgi:ketopantoate reductase